MSDLFGIRVFRAEFRLDMSVVVEYLEAPLCDAVAEERDDRAAVIIHRLVLCFEFLDYLHEIFSL